MGLVILPAPASPALTPAAGSAVAVAVAGDTAPEPSGFAALVQALLGSANVSVAGPKHTVEALFDFASPVSSAEPPHKESEGDDLELAATLASLLAGSSGPQALPGPAPADTACATPAKPAPTATSAARPTSTAMPGSSTTAAVIGDVPEAPASSLVPTAAESGVDGLVDVSAAAEADAGEATVVEGAQPVLPQALHSEPPVQAADERADDSASLVTEAAGMAPDEQTPVPPAPPRSRDHDPAERVDAPPRGEPGPNGQAAASVVRFVGNAKTDREPGADPGDKNNGNTDHPVPHASAQGIAHAATNSAVGQLRTAQETATAPDVVTQPEAAAPRAPQPTVDQVATTVIEQVERGGGEARIHLHPAELGEISIRVHVEGDHIRVQVQTQHADAMNFLRDHTSDLANLLGSRGLNLTDVFVGLGNQGTDGQAAQHESQASNQPESGEFAALLGIDDPGAVERHNRLRSAYNPDGSLSFRI